jgi:hypothetical protein
MKERNIMENENELMIQKNVLRIEMALSDSADKNGKNGNNENDDNRLSVRWR